MTSALTESDYRYLPIERALAPTATNVRVIRDHWWSVHPERGLLLYVGRGRRGGCSPQCNTSRAIVERVGPDFAEVRLLPVAYIPITIHGEFDYLRPAEVKASTHA